LLWKKVRLAVRQAAPQAEETISYQMPAFKQNGILVWFQAFKNRIGFYPKISGIETFKIKLATYQTSKGTLQFPLDKPIPRELVKKIVRFRVKENLARNPDRTS
jgi:uncharacterized protein YdhG (YjbR/CyaY superfamily)